MKGASASTITAHSFLLRTRPGVSAPAASETTASKEIDRKSTRLNSSHANISYAVFCLKKKKKKQQQLKNNKAIYHNIKSSILTTTTSSQPTSFDTYIPLTLLHTTTPTISPTAILSALT